MGQVDRNIALKGIVKAIQQCMDTQTQINETDRMLEDLQFDSLKIATLTFCIEDELGCEITLNEWVAFANSSNDLTVGSLVDYVSNKMSLSKVA